MAQGKVEICGVNTSKLPLLKEEEKEALFLRIKAGDMEAKEEYIKGNLRLVLSVIKRFSNSNENPDDLFQVGCIGLMKAIDNFDLSQGVKFSTYAVPMIIGEMLSRRLFINWGTGNGVLLNCVSIRAKPRWKWLRNSPYLRRRYPELKKMR